MIDFDDQTDQVQGYPYKKRWGRIMAIAILAALIAINGWLFASSLFLSPALQNLRTINEEKALQQSQVVEWRVNSEIADKQIRSDNMAIFSMYRQCQSLEDFFVVYPDKIVSSFIRLENGFELRFYLPPGTHKLGAAVGSELIMPRSQSENGGFKKSYTLQGGRSYQITATVEDRTDDTSDFVFRLSDVDSFELVLEAVALDGDSVAGQKEQIWLPANTTGAASDKNAKVNRERLLAYDWLLTGRESKKSGRLSLILEFESRGIPRWSAGAPDTLRAMVNIAKKENDLNDQAESRYFDPADGAYYKKKLSKDANQNSIDW